MEDKKKDNNKQELDTETTFADMNVEGMPGYDPSRKNKPKTPPEKLTKAEYRALVRGAYKAMIPMILCMLGIGALMILLAYLWLK